MKIFFLTFAFALLASSNSFSQEKPVSGFFVSDSGTFFEVNGDQVNAVRPVESFQPLGFSGTLENSGKVLKLAGSVKKEGSVKGGDSLRVESSPNGDLSFFSGSKLVGRAMPLDSRLSDRMSKAKAEQDRALASEKK